MRIRRPATARSPVLLLLAAAALLPGVLAIVAAGLCAAPDSAVGLSMSEAAGAFSFGPMLGLDRGLLAPARGGAQDPSGVPALRVGGRSLVERGSPLGGLQLVRPLRL